MMRDEKFEERKKKFQNGLINFYNLLVNFDCLEARENHKLSLRKEKVEDYFMKKRLDALQSRKNKEFAKNEINPEELNIPKEYYDRNFSTFVI
jgi:hypothetical protein